MAWLGSPFLSSISARMAGSQWLLTIVSAEKRLARSSASARARAASPAMASVRAAMACTSLPGAMARAAAARWRLRSVAKQRFPQGRVGFPVRRRLFQTEVFRDLHRAVGKPASFFRMPGIRLRVGLQRQQQILLAQPARGPGYLLLHGLCITLQEGKGVKVLMQIDAIEIARQRLLDRGLGLIETIQRKIDVAEVPIRGNVVRA